MKFGYARAVKWRVIYTIDSVVESPEFVRIFYSQSQLHTWMAQNEDKSIQRMSIMYEYPFK